MQPIRTFILDDDPDTTLLCERILAQAGFQVESSTDSQSALATIQNKPFDLLLVDINMPVVDGFAVIRHSLQVQSGAAILVMTAQGSVENAIQSLRLGVDGLILKPFGSPSELVEVAQKALLEGRKKRESARARALEALIPISESLLSHTRLQPLLDAILAAIHSGLGASFAACYENSPGGCLALAPYEGGEMGGLFSGLVASNSALLLEAGNCSPDQARLLDAHDVGALMVVPALRPAQKSLVLCAACPKDSQTFNQSDFEFFQILARQAGIALENVRLYEEQREYIHKIQQTNKALLQAEKMAAASRLSSSIAHEINNPLQIINNCLHLAGRPDLPREKRDEYFHLAEKQVQRLITTVRRMFDFYRPVSVTYDKLDLLEVMEYTLNLMSKQLSVSRVHVALVHDAPVPKVIAVGSQLQQVFISLILNAIDAMPEGGELRISLAPFGQGVELIFHDQGKGVALETQDRIFEPFFSTKEGGTGLGLTVSYNIIKTHGGTLELLSDVVQGACFRIFLPIGGKA